MSSSHLPPDQRNDVTLYDQAKSAKDAQTPSGFRNFRSLGWLILILAFVIPYGYYHGFTSVVFSIITLFEVVLLFNILIIVHELGHFLAAKWCGLKIDKFAIWFGKPLWSKKVDGVEYILGSIPAGGYVALPQMANPDAIEGKSDTPREELPPASPWQKIIVAFAGPLFSFGLAVFFATIVWVVGKPVGFGEATTTVGFVLPKNPAEATGIRPGDKILSIDGHKINHFMGMGDSVIWRIVSSTEPSIAIVVEREGKIIPFDVTPQKDIEHTHAWYERGSTRKIGVGPADEALIIKKVAPNSPAVVAGLKEGDRITQMNGQPVYSWLAIPYWLKDHPHDPIQFEVVSGGTVSEKTAADVAALRASLQPGDRLLQVNGQPTFTPATTDYLLDQKYDKPIPYEVLSGSVARIVTVTPETPISPSPLPKDGNQTDIGIAEWDPGVPHLIHPNPLHQVRESVQAVVSTISALVTPKSNVGASQLSGPIGIMNIFFAVLSTDNGWRLALWFAVLINVNLALLNLLPLPVLDGGHITLSLIEWVRRRPLSMRILEPLQTACALALIGYMAFITFYDVQDSGRMAFSSSGEIKFAPKSGSGQ